MNPLELRYEIYKALLSIVRTGDGTAVLAPPVPGQPLTINVEGWGDTPSGYRRYTITVTETTDAG